MCRWLAYSGRPIYLDAALFEPENSLIEQSLHARMGRSTTNGDGFGIGWYGGREQPGLFRDILPAWNDDNLLSVSEQICSGLFFAHVRASTGTQTSRANCHPFRYGRWLFMHNGAIGGYDQVRHQLDLLIDPAFYPRRAGTTDSETFFYLMIGNGLEEDAEGALARTLAQVVAVMDEAGVEAPFHMTAALSDGKRIHALRWSNDKRSPSLYHGKPCFDAARGVEAETIAILSEPLDSNRENWTAVPEAHLLVAEGGEVTVKPFAPTA